MKGGCRKARKREPKKTPTEKFPADTVLSQATEELNVVPGSDVAIVSKSTACSLPGTPKRGRGRIGQTQEAHLTSTPVRSSSIDISSNITKSPPGIKQVDLKYTEFITQFKTSEVDAPCCQSKSQSIHRRAPASQLRQVRKRVTNAQLDACSKTNGPPVKSRRGRPAKVVKGLQKDNTNQSFARSRPRFELEKPDAEEQDETLLSSDLSIELSHHEEQLPSLSFQEDERSDDDDDEEEEEEELPSFLMQADKKTPSIKQGVFVWHKLRSFPFWPALVKSVNHKQKKASIMFIDDPRICNMKGFTVALKTLKPFDCEEANELVCKAKEKHDAAIEWCLELITDYRIRRACGSFSGPFIEYFAHDMSYPVRRKYPQEASERLTMSSDPMMEAPYDNEEDSFSEQQEKDSRSSKRLLPDRSHAAYNRANEKLVNFIVKQRMVEGHLLAVIHRQQESRWLHSFLSASRSRGVNIYLADDQQLDKVYSYLHDLYSTAVATTPCVAEMTFMERVPFVLDVLLPEAIIKAIVGVEKVPVKKAEEKYLRGRCISNREREEFERLSDMRKKHQNTSLALFSDPIS